MRLASTLRHLAAVISLLAVLPANAGVIDFDGTAAPGLFADTTPLGDQYAALGLTFSGATGVGGEILNQAAEMGFMARSGTDFLAFNTEAGLGQDERIVFTGAQSSVSVFLASLPSGTFTLTAFDDIGNMLGTTELASSRDWQAMTITYEGIRSVVVASTTSSWALDDLGFTASGEAPEPGGIVLLGAALLGFVASRRTRV